MTNRLAGKRVFFVGAAAGIGRAAVEQYVAEGAKVVIAERDKELASATAKEIGCGFVECDVTVEASVADALGQAVTTLGGLDVLVNNAGFLLCEKITDYDGDDWDRTFAVNCKGMFLACKHAIPHLRQSKAAAIINTSSLAGRRGAAGNVPYSASKGAVIAFTTALALELAADGIRVNTICPGWVDTPFNNPAINFMGGTTEQLRVVKAMVPLGRQAVPTEIAPLFTFLASDESSYMTAQSLVIDGGVYNA